MSSSAHEKMAERIPFRPGGGRGDPVDVADGGSDEGSEDDGCCPPPPVRAVCTWLGSHWGLFDEETEVADKHSVFRWYDILLSLAGVAFYVFDIYTDVRLAVYFFLDGEYIFGGELFPHNTWPFFCVT